MEDELVDWVLRAIQKYALKGIKKAVEGSGAGIIIAGFEVSKAVLARETQQMVTSNVATTVVTGLFLEFMFGVGPKSRKFGPGSVMAVRMQDADGVHEAKKFFYKSRAKTYQKNPALLNTQPLTEYSAGFNPIMGPLRAWDDIVEQFIGNFRVEIFPNAQASEMTIVLRNVTSAHSLLLHLPFVKNYERGSGVLPTPMGNIEQLISWDEPLDRSEFEEYLD